MQTPHILWSLSALWLTLAALIFVIVDASSLRSWLYLAAMGLIPPAVVLRLWNEAPRPMVAKVLNVIDRGR